MGGVPRPLRRNVARQARGCGGTLRIQDKEIRETSMSRSFAAHLQRAPHWPRLPSPLRRRRQRRRPIPTAPILLTHGFAAGGNGDVVSRIVGEAIAPRLGQPVVIEPRPGAGGNTASARLVKSEPGRLHADQPDRRTRGVGGDLQVAAVRSGRRFPVRLGLRLPGIHDRGEEGQSDSNDRRPDRRRQGRAGQADLFVGRHRFDATSRRRIVLRDGRHHDDPRALSWRLGADDRSAGRADRPVDRFPSR